MHIHKPLRAARAATLGAVTLAVTMVFGSGVAAAAAPTDPAGGANPVAPHFYNGNVSAIRGAGSDTTLFLMQRLSDLYTGAGLYGCTLNSSAGQTLYNSSDPASSSGNEEVYCQANQNIATTDVTDNWDRTEVYEGVDDIGGTPGAQQLCGSLTTPLPVDFARGTKPAPAIGGCPDVDTGYAKDGVPAIDYSLNPSTYGTSTFSGYDSVNGGNIGPVASGWLPGDPTGGPYNGTGLSDISNVDNGGGGDSTAYRLWCASDLATGPAARITDWGQLSNLGPNLEIVDVTTTSGSATASLTGTGPAPSFPSAIAAGQSVSGPGIPGGTTVSSVSGTGLILSQSATVSSSTATLTFNIGTVIAQDSGAPIGLPIRLIGVNTGSGIESTFAAFANSNVTGGGCASNMNAHSPGDPNPSTAPSPNSAHIALQNNSDQIDQFAQSDFPNPDYVDQAIEASTTIYIESNGVFNTSPYAGAVTINGNSSSGSKLSENGGILPTAANLLSDAYPTAITLRNIYRSDTVRASTAGFLNWICDGNVNFHKATDNSTGKNFDNEIGTDISTSFGFPRLTDESVAATVSTPADGIAAPNNECAATLPVSTIAGSATVSLSAGGNFPPDIVPAGNLPAPFNNVTVGGAGLPSGDYVLSGGGTPTLTLNAVATATASNVNVTFSGVPPVTALGNSQS
jgi:hypothetical protein